MTCVTHKKGREKKVWITRTQPGASDTAKAVKLVGFTPLIVPLLNVVLNDTSPQVPKPDDILIFTSKNGVTAFCDYVGDARLLEFRQSDVITVGDGSAEAARLAGFENVRSAAGTSDDIAPLIGQDFMTSRNCLHISGNHVRGQITQELRALGFTARREIYYKSEPVSALPDIAFEELEAVMVFSPLAAKTLHGFNPDLSRCRIVSISPQTDRALGEIKTAGRLIAPRPTQEMMLTTLASC